MRRMRRMRMRMRMRIRIRNDDRAKAPTPKSCSNIFNVKALAASPCIDATPQTLHNSAKGRTGGS